MAEIIVNLFSKPVPNEVVLLGKGYPSLDSYSDELRGDRVVFALNEACESFYCDYFVYLDTHVGKCEPKNKNAIPIRRSKSRNHFDGRGYILSSEENCPPKGLAGWTASSALWVLAKWGVKNIEAWGFDGFDYLRDKAYADCVNTNRVRQNSNYRVVNDHIRFLILDNRLKINWKHRNVDYETVYEEIYNKGYHASPEFTHSANLIESLIKYDFNSILDIGCSRGAAMRILQKHGKKVFGVDAAACAVDFCKAQGLNIRWGSATLLPFQTMDAIISTDVFEHLHPNDVQFAIRECYRVAKRYIAMRIHEGPDRSGLHYGVGQLHLTQKPIDWWKHEFVKIGREMGKSPKIVEEPDKREFIIAI